MEIDTREFVEEAGNKNGNWEAVSVDDEQADGVRQFQRPATAYREKLAGRKLREEQGVDKARRLKNYSSFETFIQRIFAEALRAQGGQTDAVGMNGLAKVAYSDIARHFVWDITKTADALAHHGGRKTISAKDIQAAINLKLGAMTDPVEGGKPLFQLLNQAGLNATTKYKHVEARE